jgi:hypothetical protein
LVGSRSNGGNGYGGRDPGRITTRAGCLDGCGPQRGSRGLGVRWLCPWLSRRSSSIRTPLSSGDAWWFARSSHALPCLPSSQPPGAGASRAGTIVDSLAADARSLLAGGRSECLSHGPKGSRAGRACGLRAVPRSPATHDRVRRYRLRRSSGEDRQFPGVSCDGLRRRPLFATPDRFPAAPMWSWSGHTGTCNGRPQPATSTRGPWFASLRTTRSSTYRSCHWRCGSPGSVTWARWARGRPPRSPGAPARRRIDRHRAVPAVESGRPRFGSPDTRGDRREHRG